MSRDERLKWSTGQIAQSVRTRQSSAVEVTRLFLSEIERVNGQIAAWRAVLPELALAQAREVDRRVAQGQDVGPLAGVPYGLKDLFVTQGEVTTAGSQMLANWRPPYDSSHATRMREAGAVLLGKTSMDEFAMGSSNENTPFEKVRNPWSLSRVPGGSSGGSAAAVAARTCAFALGSDTGGSIRQPAALCGIVGLKPTYGRVSRFGMVAYASSLDQAGPMTTRVEDSARVLQALAGHDPRDATSSKRDVEDYLSACQKAPGGLRVGVFRQAREARGIDADVHAAFLAGLETLKAQGATIVDIELPHFDLGVAAYYVLATAEAASNLARFDGLRYGQSLRQGGLAETYEATRGAYFGQEVKRRILLGTFVLRADTYQEYYGRASRVRTLIAQDYTRAFEVCDVIASPTSPFPAFRLGERSDDPVAMYLADIFTTSVNLAGLPAISVPCGISRSQGEALPIGIQFVGRRFAESQLFSVAAAFETASGFGDLLPSGVQV